MESELLETLLQQAWMFDDPRAYEAGVRDAWDAWNAKPAVAGPSGTAEVA